ncbi:MAG: TlpA disulfide reductase family protein [bacterium]
MFYKKLIYFILISFVLIFCASCSTKSGKVSDKSSGGETLQGTIPGSAAPLFSLEDIKGEKVNLQDFRGSKVVLLNFWATWCASCRKEMPELERLYKKYKKQGFIILGINVEESPRTVNAFLKKQKITYPVLLDSDGKVSGPAFYHIYGVPDNIVIDKKGIVIYHKPYPPRNADKFFDEILKE